MVMAAAEVNPLIIGGGMKSTMNPGVGEGTSHA